MKTEPCFKGVKMTDQVNHPSHYVTGKMEAIDYMKDSMTKEAYQGYLEGATKKYIHRFKHKGEPLKDLQKARWYLDRLIVELTLDQDFNPNLNLAPGRMSNMEIVGVPA